MKDEQREGIDDLDDSASSPAHPDLPIKPLTARQLTAINLLAMGRTVTATAKTLGIGVSTLHRWKALHPLFRVELSRRQHDLFDSMVGKLRQTMGKAVDELFAMVTSAQKSERREVMWAMLKLLKPQKYLVPDGPVTVEDALDGQIRARRAASGEIAEADITDEDRRAAIPAEFRADRDATPLPSGEGSAAQAADVSPQETRTSDDAHAEENQRSAECDVSSPRGSNMDPAEVQPCMPPAVRGMISSDRLWPRTSGGDAQMDRRDSQRTLDGESQPSAGTA